MSTVHVNYQFHTFKAKVGRNTVLNEVLVDALRYFKVDDGTRWKLTHNGKEVELDLQWLLLNLPPGAKLDLEANDDVVNSTASKKMIKVKFQVIGSAEFTVEEIGPDDDLQRALTTVAKRQGWHLDPQQTKIQLLSRSFEYEQLQNVTLLSLGINTPIPIRVSGISNNSHPKVESGRQDGTHKLHEITVFIPSQTSIREDISEEANETEEDYEVTVEHARKYQQILSKNAGNLGGQFVSKSIRDMQSAKKNSKPPAECHIRIRFPDLTHLEVAFKPDEATGDVYNLLAQNLQNDKLPFTLVLPSPYSVLPNSNAKLFQDMKFGSKVLLLFKTDAAPPFLKEELLQKAMNISEAADIKHDRQDHVEEEGVEPVKKMVEAPQSFTKTKATPKWLRLSKK